ncbi:maltokinase [Motilibacter rhizosphaerae]|uniref:Maltokinase n=1 Tax=Motilibacter rhizosphaerae TaxID=598652 RepID=A0A4Q7NR28_9ACTN|nr:phosphotransferase [Motilibacter rhizosphaerae]RZS87070.1 maltokinase [Motilibacter rhizosphaerae]
MDAQLLHDWIDTQRWFGGKGRPWHVAGVEQLAELRGDPSPVRLVVVSLEYDEVDLDAAGGQRRQQEAYQVLASLRPEPAEHLGHVLIGESDVDGRHYWVYDGLHDKEATPLLLDLLKQGGTSGTVSATALAGVARVPDAASTTVLGGEQSNTSLVFGGVGILKAFRKLAPGVNPDIEVHEALARVGCAEIATPYAHLAGRWHVDGVEVEGDLGMMQEFLSGASGGWELAMVSVRDLFAEADLHADEVGGDFAAESCRLGEATAKVHAALAEALPTQSWGSAQLQAVADGMLGRLREAVRQVPALEPHADALARKYAALAERTDPVLAQRIHGDYHLGQVMRTAQGWRLLDFEGEPAKGLDERRRPDSTIRDVAGMLRSFDYAARFQLMDRPRDPQLEYRADEWAERNRSAFCDGYAAASGRDPRDDGDLICAYEADKAVYELIYEARNRPGWIRIPLGAIERLAAPATA